MEFAVTLQYPNGRRYNTVLFTDQAPQQGTEFELYGRTWCVTGLIDSTRSPAQFRRKVDPKGESTRILCVCVDVD
jgi:hypothetical protein